LTRVRTFKYTDRLFIRAKTSAEKKNAPARKQGEAGGGNGAARHRLTTLKGMRRRAVESKRKSSQKGPREQNRAASMLGPSVKVHKKDDRRNSRKFLEGVKKKEHSGGQDGQVEQLRVHPRGGAKKTVIRFSFQIQGGEGQKRCMIEYPGGRGRGTATMTHNGCE